MLPTSELGEQSRYHHNVSKCLPDHTASHPNKTIFFGLVNIQYTQTLVVVVIVVVVVVIVIVIIIIVVVVVIIIIIIIIIIIQLVGFPAS